MRYFTLILLFPALAFANPVDIFGYGARGQALGGAQVAKPSDSSANYYNPAAIAGFTHTHLDIGYQYAKPQLFINNQNVNVDAVRGTQLGLVAPGSVFNTPVALGVSMYVPDQHLTRTRTLSVSQPRFTYYNNRPQRMVLAFNLGVEIAKGLRIGGGISYMTRTQGGLLLDGRVGLVADQSELQTEMDIDLVAAKYGQIGIQYEVNDRLSFGAVYRTGFQLELQQRFVISADIGAENVAPEVEDAYFELNTLGRDLYQAPQLVLGMYFQPTRNISVNLDMAWHRWSTFVAPASRIEIEFDLKQFNDMVDLPPAPSVPDANFRDIIVPRLGVEWVAKRGRNHTVLLRSGYSFEFSPVPHQTGETNYIDNAKHTMSLGAGLSLPNLGELIPLPVDFNLSVGSTLMPRRQTIKSSAVDPIGSYVSKGHTWQAAFTSNWRF